jgi:hypothetical protein
MGGEDDKKNEGEGNTTEGVSFASEPSGTLTVINNMPKDMVLFQGETPPGESITSQESPSENFGTGSTKQQPCFRRAEF